MSLPILDILALSSPKLYKPSITLSKVNLPINKPVLCGHSPQILTGLFDISVPTALVDCIGQ